MDPIEPETVERPAHPQAALAAGGPKTRLTVRQLAVSQKPRARDLADTGGSRPEIGAGSDAALPHLDHDDIYAQIVPLSQRRALQQLSAFASGGIASAALETAALVLDFSANAKSESARIERRSNSRSKTFHIN